MSGSDIVGFYDGNGDLHFTRAAMYDAWLHAGRPPINSSGRLKWMQQAAWDAYQNGTGSPADDPNRPALFPLAHVRYGALDIDPTPYIVARMTEAGMVRPYSYEPWHWELPGIRNYPLVDSVPQYAVDNVIPYYISMEDIMAGPILVHWPNNAWRVFDMQIPGGSAVPRSDEEANMLIHLHGEKRVGGQREWDVALAVGAWLNDLYRAGVKGETPPVVVEPPKA
jgi:hypothetical protein